MNHSKILDILKRIDPNIQANQIHTFQNKEDGNEYSVWKINDRYVLKEAKGFEPVTYRLFFTEGDMFAPRLLGSAKAGEQEYILIEYVKGEDLCRCHRDALQQTLDSLIAMQRKWWQAPEPADGFHFTQSISGREKRLNYLKDTHLEDAYREYLCLYQSIPRTLCHDDLLPFNVICGNGQAVFIDWEYGGILPYLTSLARLIAHCEETEDAFFYMTDADKAFAIDYYFDHFVNEIGITKDEYLKSLGYFLLYEYCEWVYVGNCYNQTDTDRYQSYFQKAKTLAEQMGY